MPSLQQLVSVRPDQQLYSTQLDRLEATVARKAHRRQPELGRAVVAVNVDMRRFVQVVTHVVDAVRPISKDGRHPRILQAPSPDGSAPIGHTNDSTSHRWAEVRWSRRGRARCPPSLARPRRQTCATGLGRRSLPATGFRPGLPRVPASRGSDRGWTRPSPIPSASYPPSDHCAP